MTVAVSRALQVALFALASCGSEPTSGLRPGVQTRWYQPQAGYAEARPAVIGDVVYFGTGDGQVVARDQRTGAARWAARVGTGEALRGGNLLVRSGVLVAPVVRHIAGIDAASGTLLWQYSPPPDTVAHGTGAPAGSLVTAVIDADAEAVYVPAWGASVSAVDLKTGAARWVWQPGRNPSDTAAGVFRSGAMGTAVSGDTVFVGAWHFLDRQGLRSEPWLVALDRRTGRELWRAVLPSYTGGVLLIGAPAVAGPRVLLATVGGHVWAVDQGTQRVAWHHVPQTKQATVSGVQLAGGVAYADGGDERIYALDAATGAVRWSMAVEGGAKSELLVTARRVYVPRALDVQILDRASGRRVAAATLPGSVNEQSLVSSAPAFADGRVFVTTNGAAWSFNEP